MTPLPLIVDIKRHSLEDGPGIRSVVFFKGCPMRCIFCHNPETQDTEAEIVFSDKDCIRCGICKDACPQGAIDLETSGHIKREICDRCGKCTDVCPTISLKFIGDYYQADVLAEILMRDISFYKHSNGGVTLSGGECTMYPDYLESLLKILKENNIHVVLETSGYFEYDIFKEKILPYIDLIYYDIKSADSELHRRYTGKPNQRVIDNLYQLLKEEDIEVRPRVPLIPDITATRENLSDIVDLLYKAGAEGVSLLPYNPMGIEMYVKLGKKKPPLPEGFMRPEEEKEVYDMIKTKVGGLEV